jgi:hypothetical protein
LVTPAELPAEADDLDHANGIVQPLASVGLPATDIAAAKQRFPNLDTDYVLSAGWEWTDTKSPVDLEVGFFKWIIGFVALLSALFLDWNRRLRSRRRTLASDGLRLLAAPGETVR